MTTTFRNAVFQLHWFLGITAGVVLAVVGFSGAMLSFEDKLLKALNPGVMTVEARGPALAPAELVARIADREPAAKLQSLALSADRRNAAKVTFAPKPGAAKGPGGRARGESRHVDPYTGALLPKPRGEGFFRTTMQLHRWLVMDDVGKQIVGFSTVVLLFFCGSGLYLRWPRRWRSLRTWLGLDWRQKGRNFLWHLHAVVGTWVLVAYLMMALSGLTWSYPWFRDGLNALAGVSPPAEMRGGPPRGELAGRGGGPVEPPGGKGDGKGAATLDIGAAWDAFGRAAPAWSAATMQWPRDGGGVQFRYLDAEPAHERASNTIELDPATLAVRKHARYDAKPLAQRLAGSYFALHRGSYFGTAGVVLFMLASALMPLFAISGWMLYLDRRRKQRAARELARQLPPSPAASAGAPLLVAHASQTGSAERLAWRSALALREAGCAVDVLPLGRVTLDRLGRTGRALFVVSTFGDGEAPDSARAFARTLRANETSLPKLRYGVLALGDREYGEHYCRFGRTLDQGLHHAGARALFDRVDVDAGDAGALRHWQHHIGQLAGRTDLPDWKSPTYRRWQLAGRAHLNPGSPGGPAFHLALTPIEPDDLAWQAGDIAEIGPRNEPAAVAAWLGQAGLDGNTDVSVDGASQTLASLLARTRLPEAPGVRGRTPQAVADLLKPLPHREYSIASLPGDGELQLLVRQMRQADGRLGSGSGWLTAHARLGDPIDLRIRSNPSFHAPPDDRPLVLLGNGTGMAGLRALLKTRIAAGQRRNWLLFGERTAAHDFHYGGDIESWRREGHLERLDLAFSRDRPGPASARRYVQHVLGEQAGMLRSWLDDGAAVYVCGSLAGMAPAVEAALQDMIGGAALEAMAAGGRYRRDVY